MAFINYAAREIQIKIVYYGASGSGKTTNLRCLHDHLKAQHQSDLVSLPTEADRALFFEFLLLDTHTLEGFKTRFQLYTVPGQPLHNSTRQMILKGVDGIVFVVDSQADRMAENVESFENLQENLALSHLSLAQIPFVLQYNKRDLPEALPLDYLEFAFNNRATKAMALEASAAQERGVLETLNALSQILLAKFARFSEEGWNRGPRDPDTSSLIEIVSH